MVANPSRAATTLAEIGRLMFFDDGATRVGGPKPTMRPALTQAESQPLLAVSQSGRHELRQLARGGRSFTAKLTAVGAARQSPQTERGPDDLLGLLLKSGDYHLYFSQRFPRSKGPGFDVAFTILTTTRRCPHTREVRRGRSSTQASV